MEIMNNAHEEFVTVVSVGTVDSTRSESENFVTVLSIGNGGEKVIDHVDARNNLIVDQKSDEVLETPRIEKGIKCIEELDDKVPADSRPEEEVDVFRLPGERLGFGLKFEGGNKTSEKVRKLFIQSCANESPASRAVCSWGTLGEGDEVLSIDGVPVTKMTRLDCVRRLKESQLVIKLLVRYHGALRPEVVSAELKSSSTDNPTKKIPPELPAAPPPVPPRKLRQPRGPADGDANPSPVRKPSWDQSPKSLSSSSSSSTSSSSSSVSSSATDSPARTQNSSGKSTVYESCASSPTASTPPTSKNGSKNSSPKSGPPSSRIPGSPESRSQTTDPPEAFVYLDARSHDGCSTHGGSTSDDTGSSMSTVIDRFSLSDRYSTTSTASAVSEHPGNRSPVGDAPVEISSTENIDLVRLLAPFDQLERELGSNPPTTDYLLTRLANSESVTLVESLGDGGGVVERVTALVAPNTVLIEETITLQPPLSFQDAPLSYGHEPRPGLVFTDLAADSSTHFRPIKDDALVVECVNGNVDPVGEQGPPLPARNRLVKEEKNPTPPALPPKPMPRRDVKTKRKRPPPPPPPPRREIEKGIEEPEEITKKVNEQKDEEEKEKVRINNERNLKITGDLNAAAAAAASSSAVNTNKMMEIIEMKKAKALMEKIIKDNNEVKEDKERKENLCEEFDSLDEDLGPETNVGDDIDEEIFEKRQEKEREEKLTVKHTENDAQDDEDSTDESDGDSYYWQSNLATIGEEEETNSLEFNTANCRNFDSEEDEEEKEEKVVVNDVGEKLRSVSEIHLKEEPKLDRQSMDDGDDQVDCLRVVRETSGEVGGCCPIETKGNKSPDNKSPVNGRMENCGGGGQRLPPDGDEFPATYQEFSSSALQQQHQQYQFVAPSVCRVSSTSLEIPIVPAENTIDKNVIPSKFIDTPVTAIRGEENSKILAFGGDPLPMTDSTDCESSHKGLSDGNLLISEKKISIKIGKSYSIVDQSSPPPLPNSRPPKTSDFVPESLQRAPSGGQRKFSLNGDLWRQDDKSERSVRDKIAMFSSQSRIEAPLFPALLVSPSSIVGRTSSGARRLSKYKSSEDVFAEGETAPLQRTGSEERTRSTFDLSISSATATVKFDPTPPSLPLTSPPSSPSPKFHNPGSDFVSQSKTTPDALHSQKGEPRPSIRHSASLVELKTIPQTKTKTVTKVASFNNKPTMTTTTTTPMATTTSVARATSFSGGSSSNLHSRSQSLTDLPPTPTVSRTNSLASTFKRPNDDMRRTSLNQLIEQRRKGIWKLRGLVIPEKEALPVSQPIVQDLPEIKSRDSIILQQIPRANIQDKWGSQSSISSSISSASVPSKTTTSFKIPEPQNLPKYSPAFKRKSLAVYGNSGSPTIVNKSLSSSTLTGSSVPEPPKSLESICSPTRSDFSFEYVPASRSPRSRATLRKARTEYDDSDNDSAVSSSQSSLSRGFSPPGSPAPSERSTLSSERSYLSAEAGTRTNCYHGSPSERSSSSSSSPEVYGNSRSIGLKRSSSTDTNCSSSSTLTSGSQASAESLSRRVLKPQSVEAINRKNILASARCRSGRDLNGSPLIQRKFDDEGETPVSKLAQVNLNAPSGRSEPGKIKIAYIDVTTNDNEIKTSAPFTQRNVEAFQPSNELKKWVRSEVKTIVNSTTEIKKVEQSRAEIEVQLRSPRRRSSLVIEEKSAATLSEAEPPSLENSKPRSRSSLVLERSAESQNDLLSVLATKSRSRSTIHIEERTFGRSRSQMSLEEILDAKGSEPPARSWLKDKGFSSKIPTPKGSDPGPEEGALKDARTPSATSRIPTPRALGGRRSASVTDMKKALLESQPSTVGNTHIRFPSLESSGDPESERYSVGGEQFGSISSLASTTSLISQQELAQLVEEATLEEARGAHEVIVVLYHKENPAGSVGIALAGGVDCETKEITVHRVLAHSIADKDGRVQRGDRILSINGRSTKSLTHRESLAVLKQPRSEIVLVVSRPRDEANGRLRTRTESVETIVEGSEINGAPDEQTAWGPPATVVVFKDGAGLGFSLEGGRDSPLGDRPLIVKKIFSGGAAEKTGALRAGDQMLEVNGIDVTRMSRIEAWSLMKKLHDGEVSLLVRHPATKSSS